VQQNNKTTGNIKSSKMIRTLKTLHGWLGFFVMPWIVIIGLTGLYLNHSKLVLSWLPSASYDESLFDEWPDPQEYDLNMATALAAGVFPEDSFTLSKTDTYYDRDVFQLKGQDQRRVIVTKATGHYWVKTRFTRKTYDPDGRQIDSKIYWGKIFSALHRRGWINSTLGTWLADITAGAMVIFGISGFFMFLVPKLRRRKNKAARAKVEVARSNVPRPQRIRLKPGE
jgi:uncharacterized protein